MAILLAPAASFATKVPLPIEGATMNIGIQIQPQFLTFEAGRPDGTGPSYDLAIRRTRLSIGGDVGSNFSYYFQVDNANFGRYGNFTSRMIVQDAWVGWAPTGITGGTVVYIDAGLLLFPYSHQSITSTTNYITADGQTDGVRFPGSPFNANRDTGIQLRGWTLGKRIGFRGGIYEGYTPAGATLGASPANANTAAATNCAPATPGSCVTPKRYPAVRGFLNFSVIGAEEGTWLYGSYRWAKDPVVSIGVATNYQSQALKNAFGNVTDLKLFSADVYANIPMTEAAEFVTEITVFSNNNGTGSANTGLGLAAAAGYRWQWVAPYVGFDYFSATDCDTTSLSPAQVTTCLGRPGTPGTAHSADSRNFKGGLNFFINKNLNHINVEFQVNHGLSAYGPAAISGANAAYVPLALDPFTPTGARRPLSVVPALAQPAFKSFLVHWNYVF